MTTLINRPITGHSCPSSGSEDELLLSPGKQETYMQGNHSKRSASPPPEDEYSSLSGSTSNSRNPKRVKRGDSGLEDSESDRVNPKLADLFHQRSTRGHARNLSDSDVLIRKRSTRKRSATVTKKPISTVTAIPTPLTFSPTEKGRAQSVPLFVSFNDVPHIDFRNPPPSPKRSRSRSPSKDREPKLRITSTSFAKLGAISVVEVVGESGSTLKPVEVLLLPKITEETTSTNETSTLDPPICLTSIIQNTLPEIPSTPLAKQSLNELMPMSPLTPLPETPFSAEIGTDVEDRSLVNTGWEVPSAVEANTLEQTTKPPLGIVASTSRSRLPRPSLAPSLTFSAKLNSTTTPLTLPTSTSSASNKSNAITAKKKEEPTVLKDAFSVLMAKPREAKRMKEKTEKERTEKIPHHGHIAGPSTSSQPLRSEKQKITAKDRMRGKQKGKLQKTTLFVPDEEEEDSHTETELTAPVEDQNRFVASSNSPEHYSSSTQIVQTAASEDTAMVPLSKFEIKNRDTIMSEQEDHQIPLIGDIEATAAVPNEKVVEMASPQPPPASLLLEENANSTSELTKLVLSESGTLLPKVGPSKLPRAKRRQPASVPIVDRVTRSVSSKQKGKADLQSVFLANVTKGQASGLPVPAKRTASGSIKGLVSGQEQHAQEIPLPPGSPMKLSSPAKSTQSTARDIPITEDGVRSTQTGTGQSFPGKTPTKSRIPIKPISSPSPAKLARDMSRFSSTTDGLVRSFSMDTNQQTSAGSSLSTLSNALEKLRMPPPSRPNTSMGFNRDEHGSDDDDTFKISARSKDDAAVGRISLGLGRSESGLKRAATLGTSNFKDLGPDVSSLSKTSTSAVTKKPLVQKSLAMFMSGKAGATGRSQPAAGVNMRGGIRSGLVSKGPTIFGVGGGLRRTISKKTSLPSVMASPIKGGGTDAADEIMQDTIQDVNQDAQAHGSETLVTAPTNTNNVLQLDDLENQGTVKEKEKASTFGFNSSRRVSMISVSHALSQSLNSLHPPQSKIRGLMGPPQTPPASGRTGIRSSSSTYPSTSASGDSPTQPGTSIGTRSSARIAKTAPNALMKIKEGTDGHVSSGKKEATEVSMEPNPIPETHKILSDCIIFVDVRTDDGDEAGSLFIDMLGGVGARVLTRVGQTCTHIVFKNGLMSTLTRYRMLRDPKPLVVGIAWVVECVEQRKRVDETKFLVDIEDLHYGTGTSKRRRSMLPRLTPNEVTLSSDTEREDGDADRSMDGSSSSMIIDEVLPPLELARRRKSMLLGPRP